MQVIILFTLQIDFKSRLLFQEIIAGTGGITKRITLCERQGKPFHLNLFMLQCCLFC